jgi:hypothetical protein
MNIEHSVEKYDDRNKENKGDIIIAHCLLVTMEAKKMTLSRGGADYRELQLISRQDCFKQFSS